MDALQLFGAATAAAILLFYALEDYSFWTVLGLAVSAALAAVAAALMGFYWNASLAACLAFVATKRWQKRRLAGRPGGV